MEPPKHVSITQIKFGYYTRIAPKPPDIPFEMQEHYAQLLSDKTLNYLQWRQAQVLHGKSLADLTKMSPPD